MTTCLAVFVAAFLVALGATVGVRSMALRLGIVDRPDNYRKVHQRAMPRLGGVAIYGAFAAALTALYLMPSMGLAVLVHEHEGAVAGLLAGAAVALLAGIIDDVRGLRPRWKLLFQGIAAGIAVAAGCALTEVSNPFGEPVELGLLSVPISVFWLLGCMNAVNLIDGLDGLAAGVCLLVCVTLFLVGLIVGEPLLMLLMACLSGAILGFLLFNFHPASIFLGDSGSLLLGFLVGALSLLGPAKAAGGAIQLIPLIVLGLPLFDTVLAILRRWSHKLPLSAGDRHHVHHVLLAMGLSHGRVVLVLYMACVVLGAAALLITFEQAELTMLVLGSLGVTAFVCARLFGGLRLRDLWGRLADELAHKQRAGEARILVEKAVARMRAAASIEELWAFASEAVEGLGFDYAKLRFFESPASSPLTLAWPDDTAQAMARLALEPDLWSARLHVRGAGRAFGELEVAKVVEQEPLLADAPELLARVREAATARIGLLYGAESEAAPRTHRPMLADLDRVGASVQKAVS